MDAMEGLMEGLRLHLQFLGRESVSIRVAKELQQGPTYPKPPALGNQRHHPTWHCPSAPAGTVTGLGGEGGWLVQDPSLLPGKSSLLSRQGDSGCSHPDVLRDPLDVLRDIPGVLTDPRAAHGPPDSPTNSRSAHRAQIYR